MHGLIMDYQLTLPAILRRAERVFARQEIVSRRPDRGWHRYTYAECIARARRLAVALRRLGVGPDDRVATFAWNHSRHLEAYYAIPWMGSVLHTLNLRLHPDELTYIARHAGDRVALVDATLLPLFQRFAPAVGFERVVVMGDEGSAAAAGAAGYLDYETLCWRRRRRGSSWSRSWTSGRRRRCATPRGRRGGRRGCSTRTGRWRCTAWRSRSPTPSA
jgi:fatty-acyl-CoA synthase